MLNSKYFYYLFLINALINIINYVPRTLINDRFAGALPSIFISMVVGTMLLYGFAKTISHFGGKGLPEIFAERFSKIISLPLLILYSGLWFVAGIITMISFVDITVRFVSPDISPYAVIIGFLLVVSFFAHLSEESILYALETLLFLFTPIILYILIKSLLSPDFSWDAVMQVITYMWTKPKYGTVAAGTFIFSGYFNLAIFNRCFKRLNTRYIWTIPITGLMILLVTFLVPIGYHGTIGVEDHIFSWFSTADSIRMELFIIERLLFLFYTIYLALSLVSAVIHWHVGLELFKGAFGPKEGNSGFKKADWWILGSFSLLTVLIMSQLDQERLALFGQWFLNVRLVGEFALLAVILFVRIRSVKKA
ncbi:GerAB/ArcD/ProY family transporter [Paenibacillus sp. M1]|uniref:GerAB/ArcD/ProY family transporter n=1 Tax=Paenibacillus haidiansis TaxID=1574488 RepID=A0ABU7VV33_9BACL